MRHLKYSILLIIIAFFLSSVSSEVFAENTENKIIIAEKDSTQNNIVCYEVFGMDCPGCQSALEKQVKKIDGVAEAKASFKEKEVVIKLKQGAKVSEEEIEKRIKKANFTPGKKKSVAGNEK